jgi:hypothetical protein
MNQGLKRFKMHRTPVPVLEQHPLAVSSYQTAKKFGCEGTKREAWHWQDCQFSRFNH